MMEELSSGDTKYMAYNPKIWHIWISMKNQNQNQVLASILYDAYRENNNNHL